jgi:hypothetical protein
MSPYYFLYFVIYNAVNGYHLSLRSLFLGGSQPINFPTMNNEQISLIKSNEVSKALLITYCGPAANVYRTLLTGKYWPMDAASLWHGYTSVPLRL